MSVIDFFIGVEEFGVDNSEFIKSIISSGIGLFFQHPIIFGAVLIFLVFLISTISSIVVDNAETWQQNFIFLFTIHAIVSIITFVTLWLCYTGEIYLWSKI